MRRVLIVVAAVAIGLGGVIGPARADYHNLCASAPLAQDTHSFASSGGELRARALIQCYNRTITVQTFQILNVATRQVMASLPAPLECVNVCTGDQTQIGTPLAAGYYEVSLRFRVSGNSFDNVRQSEYLFTGSGQPTQTCGFRFGAFPIICI